MTNKRQLDPLLQYLAMENGALSRKMQRMEEEHEQEMKIQIALNLQTDAQLQETTDSLETAEARIDQYEETMTVARQRMMEQHFKIVEYKKAYNSMAMEIFQLRRTIACLKTKNKSPSMIEETSGETTESE